MPPSSMSLQSARRRGHFAVAFALAAAFASVAAAPLRAQDPGPPETVRGRVTEDSAKMPLPGATVVVTRGPDRLVQQTTTDSAGGFSTRFEQGTGDYLVAVSAPGYKSARRRVQREGTERELVANFELAKDLTQLNAIRVAGQQPVRATNPTGPFQGEPGSAEKWQDGVSGQLPPTVVGDLNATALAMPGVTMTAGGPSILGGGAESNLTTLNGMGMAGATIPRAARTETRVTGATFDPTRGGFSGANIDVRLGRGDRFYQRRNGFVTLDPPAFQLTDAVGRSLGAQSGGGKVSFGADGELIRQAMTYNVALDIGRSSSEPSTLLDAGAATLLRAGLSPDSAARLLAVAGPIGLAAGGANVPDSRNRDAITWLGRLDDTRDSLRTRAFTSYVGFTREGALGFGPLVAPSAGGERRERTLGAQITLGEYVGPGRRILTETRLSASHVRTDVDPYRELPGATVLVRSPTLEDQQDVSSISLGGSPYLNTNDRRWTLEGANETVWFKSVRRHRFKGFLWGRADGLQQEAVNNRLGIFSFNSIDDFAGNRPTSFTRTLEQPSRDGTVWNSAAALAHYYAPSRYFNVIYGARLEASGFGSAPARNPALESALGVRTGAAPTRVHLSPRAGFSFQYNRERDNGQGSSQNNVGRFFRSPFGVVRGGIGEFRDLLRPGLIADASAATGLGGGTTYLSCVGAAVPVVDWDEFASDPTSIPTQCVGGGGTLAERAPSVTLIDPSYDVPRSWRASLDWNTSYRKFLVRVSTLASYDLSQPGTVDANFAGTPRFTTGNIDQRPVFVSEGAIDPASGAVSAAESRRSNQFGRVGMRTSDLRGYGGQVTLGITPDVFRRRGRFESVFVGLNYTLQRMLRQFRGFDGAAFGDPREREWASGPNDARHVFVLQGGFSTSKTGTITFFGRAQSGLPFTPVAQGDINGDGRSGDRAFVPALFTASSFIDPSSPDEALRSELRSLLDNGSESARSCIQRFAGRVAGRNACRGPWTQSLNVQWRPPLPKKLRGRVTPNVYFQNVLGGVDQLVHGSSGLRGWGGQSIPDPVLLVPKGFDPASKKFAYSVNPRFADTRPGRTLLREPFRVVIDFSLDLSTNYDVQQLRRALEPVKTKSGWTQRGPDSLASFYLSRTSSIHTALLSESDSLFLSNSQIRALRAAEERFAEQVRAVFIPLGQFLAESRGREPGKAELDSVSKTDKAYWKIFWVQPEIADSILTPLQKDLFPMLKSMVATPMKQRENSRWMFGSPVKMAPPKKEETKALVP